MVSSQWTITNKCCSVTGFHFDLLAMINHFSNALLLVSVRDLISFARQRVVSAVNVKITRLYWQIGC